MDISIFLPCRSSSERVINKNIKKFHNKGFGLFQLKIEQLVLIRNISKVIVSTNDRKIINFLNKKKYKNVKIDVRPDFLCSSSTSTDRLIKHVPKIIKSKHILWTHVTSPFFSTKDYEHAIDNYKKKLYHYDSLMGVTVMQDFVYNKKGPVNYNKKILKWPKTQNLKKLYVVNNSIFITSRNNYLKNNDRIGKKPYLLKTEKIKSFDIDWPEDFKIAEKIYEAII